MKRCDLFVLPTYYSEGLPVTILEAMACGKAVITCKQRGCDEEIVENVTGYFVKPRNSEQLAEKIDLLLSNDILRSKMGKAGRKRVEQLFSLKKAIETFCSTISTIVNAWKPVK
jgi:glycosyltransferase involved in cell wall biosynthesis